MVFCLLLGMMLTTSPVKAEETTWPVDGFWNSPYDPSTIDWMYFGLYGETPTTWSCQWDFGDGTFYDQCYVEHAKRFSADGDFTVRVQVTNDFGETSSTSRVVSVRTHDVSITKLTVPKSAKANQTRELVVSVSNSRYPENVQVEFYKVTPDGLVWIGTLIQLVPVHPSNRTTPFSFNYTFTMEDARVGKVTFRAMAFTLDARDAWPADNEVISLPIRVSR
jgi:hypothetical protein